jgi:hypothetical protein
MILVKKYFSKNLTGQNKSQLSFFWKKLAKISPYHKIQLFKISQNFTHKKNNNQTHKNDQETISEHFFIPTK